TCGRTTTANCSIEQGGYDGGVEREVGSRSRYAKRKRVDYSGSVSYKRAITIDMCVIGQLGPVHDTCACTVACAVADPEGTDEDTVCCPR
nr:hypothetical protein [Tanacetum cinerariifolium]